LRKYAGSLVYWAIQFAKARGAKVTATYSMANVELCNGLGANEIIDYNKVNILLELEKRGPIFDLVVDNVGSTGFYEHSHKFLQPNGVFVQVGLQINLGSMGNLLKRVMLPRILGGGSTRFKILQLKTTTERLTQIGE